MYTYIYIYIYIYKYRAHGEEVARRDREVVGAERLGREQAVEDEAYGVNFLFIVFSERGSFLNYMFIRARLLTTCHVAYGVEVCCCML